MLRVRITKRPDGSGVLHCTRADGSVTWQKQEKHAAFFALHDLTHFAVESSLGFKRGFFGLIAEGWDIDDTTGKGSRGPLPAEAIEVEHVVGFFDREAASGTPWSAEDFNEYAALEAASAGRVAPRKVSNEDLLRVRTRRGELFALWFALPAGEAIHLDFEPSDSR